MPLSGSTVKRVAVRSASVLALLGIGCSDTSSGGGNSHPINSVPPGTNPVGALPAASCASDGGSETLSTPKLVATLFDRWHEAWLGSPAVADLDGDGTNEIIVPRDDVLLVWHLDGTLVRKFDGLPGRIWSSPVVADLRPDIAGLELAVASRGQVSAWDAHGNPLPGFPFQWRDEMRSIAAEDIDGDGQLELVMVTTSDLVKNGQTDILMAIHADGTVVNGFPPNTTGASGCDANCYVHAGYDQNVALGDVDGDGIADILAPQDNAPNSQGSVSFTITTSRNRATPMTKPRRTKPISPIPHPQLPMSTTTVKMNSSWLHPFKMRHKPIANGVLRFGSCATTGHVPMRGLHRFMHPTFWMDSGIRVITS